MLRNLFVFAVLLGTVNCQEEESTPVDITLTNAAFNGPTAPIDGCPESTAATVLEITQDETVTTDWFGSEPCACTGAAQSPDAYWEAEFDGANKYEVTQVRLLARLRPTFSYTYDYMRGIKIFIDDQECHTIPDDSGLNGEWYEFECDNGAIKGDKIKLQQQRDSKILFCGIEVKGVE